MILYIIIALVVIGYVLNILVIYKYDEKGFEQECLPLAFVPYLGFVAHVFIILYYAIFLGKYESFWG